MDEGWLSLLNPKLRRDVHLGIDIFADIGTKIQAPLGGKVIILKNNSSIYDYGPTVVLEHVIYKRVKFFTLYGHLSKKCLKTIKVAKTMPETIAANISLRFPKI